MLDIAARYHCMQFQRTEHEKMAKKPSLDFNIIVPNLDPKKKKFFVDFLPLLDVRHCCKLSLYAVSGKTNEPNFRK